MALLGERNFRVFLAGYATSLLGSAMSPIATTFAVLGQHGSPADLGYVLAAGVVPQVLFMIGGGVLADRLGRSAPQPGVGVLVAAPPRSLAPW